MEKKEKKERNNLINTFVLIFSSKFMGDGKNG